MQAGGYLTLDETTIISGALDLTEKVLWQSHSVPLTLWKIKFVGVLLFKTCQLFQFYPEPDFLLWFVWPLLILLILDVCADSQRGYDSNWVDIFFGCMLQARLVRYYFSVMRCHAAHYQMKKWSDSWFNFRPALCEFSWHWCTWLGILYCWAVSNLLDALQGGVGSNFGSRS